MLIQMPRGPSVRRDPQNGEEANPFESGLRRDLAGSPIISYDSVIGGWAKRGVDLALTILTAPLWLILIGVGAAWARVRNVQHVLLADDVVGYGGQGFSRYLMQLTPPSAVIAAFPGVAIDDTGAEVDVGAREDAPQSKWLLLLESLPGLFNVLRGEMSIVGPAALRMAEVETLKGAKRQYLSARPGLIGLDLLGEMKCDAASACKAYALSWSMVLDAEILWKAARGLFSRGVAQSRPNSES
ncbi:MAG: sugar transferase [Hyphomonadaceae bacterium]|nr:sugar transferase [Hyphomonadaceae bacterium]